MNDNDNDDDDATNVDNITFGMSMCAYATSSKKN